MQFSLRIRSMHPHFPHIHARWKRLASFGKCNMGIIQINARKKKLPYFSLEESTRANGTTFGRGKKLTQECEYEQYDPAIINIFISRSCCCSAFLIRGSTEYGAKTTVEQLVRDSFTTLSLVRCYTCSIKMHTG